jgi:hypothetical protein
MSQWGTLEAHFKSGKLGPQKFEIEHALPTGSETGPTIYENKGGFWVSGRLRDVSDYDSPAVLAWFIQAAQWAESGDLTWDIDGGPKYRYEWGDSGLTKLRGILD